MTDKEKIELIIQDKHLNSTQFCNEVGIVPGTLSHIRSGRTEPSLNILRSIAPAFPDINPAWLFYGAEPMYLESDSPTPHGDDVELTHINNIDATETAGDIQMSFAFPDSMSQQPAKPTATANKPIPVFQPAAADAPRRSMLPPGGMPTPLNVQEIVSETLKQQQKPQRRIVEVRIFFDDGTFETFSAH